MDKILGESYIPNGDEAPTHVSVKKIDNGYVIESCCCSKEQAEFIKNLSKAPSVIARMFKIKKEDRKSIEDNTKVENEEGDEKEGKVSLKVKITR